MGQGKVGKGVSRGSGEWSGVWVGYIGGEGNLPEIWSVEWGVGGARWGRESPLHRESPRSCGCFRSHNTEETSREEEVDCTTVL